MGSEPSITDLAVGQPSFGRRLADRVRSPLRNRSGLTRPLVGSVGRTSLGFSRALGRAQGIRSEVTLAGLNTPTLRPPPGFWRRSGNAVPRSELETSTSQPIRTVVARPVAATWTDRLLPSPAGNARTVIEQPSQPAKTRVENLPTDPKFERMRKLFAERIGVAVDPAGPQAAQRRPGASMSSMDDPPTVVGEDHPAPDALVGRRLQARSSDPTRSERGDTAAGPGTSPGRFAKLLRPEPTRGEPEVTSVSGSFGRDERAPISPRPPSPGSQFPTTGQRTTRAATTSRPAAATTDDRLDAVRRYMRSQGAPPITRTQLDDGPHDDGPSSSPVPQQTRPSQDNVWPGDVDRHRGSDTVDSTRPDLATIVAASVTGETPPVRMPGSDGSRPTDPAHPSFGADNSDVAAARRRADRADRAGRAGRAGQDIRSQPNDDRRAEQIENRTSTFESAPGIGRRGGGVTQATLLGRLPDDASAGSSPVLLVADVDAFGEHVEAVSRPRRSINVLPIAPPSERPIPTLPGVRPEGRIELRRRLTLPRALSIAHRPVTTISTVARSVSARNDIDVTGTGRVERESKGAPPGAVVDLVSADLVSADLVSAPHSASRSPTAGGDLRRFTVGEVHGGEASPMTLARPRDLGGDVAATMSGEPTQDGPFATQRVSVVGRVSNLRTGERSPGSLRPPAPVWAGRSIVAPGTGALSSVLRATTPGAVAPINERAAERSIIVQPPIDGDERPVTNNGAVTEPDRSPPDQSGTGALARRFMTELSRTVARRADPLPASFKPLSEAIVGQRRVLLSTDSRSRRALRSVGKVAATTSNIIHLDPHPFPLSRLPEVIAHELTHVANPSPIPRFFDDGDDSPEERTAERVARTMARSPLSPSASILTPPRSMPKQPDLHEVIRRSRSPELAKPASGSSASPASASSTVSADAFVARIAGEPNVPRQSVQRFVSPAAVGSPPTTPATSPSPSSASAGIPNAIADDAAEEWFREQLRDNFGDLIHLIEDRLIEDFERRGGRLWGGL